MYSMWMVFISVCVLDLVYTAPAPVPQKDLGVTSEALDKEVLNVPRTLRVGDKIEIMGQMTNTKEMVTVNLVNSDGDGKPDYNNVACQVKLDFPSSKNSNKDMITINTIVDGVRKEQDEEINASHVFSGNTFFIQFIIGVNKVELDIMNMSTSQDCRIEYGIDKIKFITVGGDLEKITGLSFIMV